MSDHAPDPAPDSDLIGRLGLNRLSGGRTRRRLIWAGAGVFILIVILFAVFHRGPRAQFVTQKVTRGALTVVISATGTLQPRNQVDVGAEISGKIDALYVDFNDHVKKGQKLARINTDQLQAQLAQAQATLASARAAVLQADATLKQDTLQKDREVALAKSNAASKQEVDSAIADFGRAQAALDGAKAQVAQGQAEVEADRTMLSKAIIVSPIDGVVLDRKVSAGQTVVAAMTTPVLYTLASDLSHMELDVDIDEADVGQVRVGDPASFTVDAYPGRRFAAKLIALHNAPQTVQGVVTYEGVLLVDNPQLLLKPGMTATAALQASSLKDALKVPNAALRFVPAEDAKTDLKPDAQNTSNAARVWTAEDGKLIHHDLKTGASDGKDTAVLGGDVKQGDEVVVDVKTPEGRGSDGAATH